MVINQALPDTDIIRKIKWVLFFRMILVIFCIVLIVLLTAGEALTQGFIFSLVVLAVALVLDLFYLAIFRWVRDHLRFVLVQVIADAILESILIYLTGGANSVFTFLFLATIFSATMCIYPRMGYIFATGITVILGIITLVYTLGVQRTIPLPLLSYELVQRIRLSLTLRYVLVRFITHAIAFYMVAALGGYLASYLMKYRVLYEEILDNMAEGLIAIDDTGRIIYINDEARRLMNHISGNPIIFKNIKDVFRRREEQHIVDILIKREETNREISITMRDEQAKDINIKTSVLQDSRNRPRGIIGIFTDLTMRNRLQDAERRAARLQEIEELATSIAHEIRNPLASIRGAIQEITGSVTADDSKGTLKESAARRLAEIAVRESDRLDSIIGNFLRFARMKTADPSEFSIVPLLEEVTILLRQRSDAAGVEITCDCKDTRVFADSELLKQAFLNIGVNALEALKGSGTLAISTAVRTTTGSIIKRKGKLEQVKRKMLEIHFQDTGSGIDHETIDKVFNPFFTTKTDGTGLGLSIVYKIVHMLESTIDIESEKDRGTRVTIGVPIAGTGNAKTENG